MINLQWLKDSNEQYSYARVVGSICILVNIVCLFRNYEVISNIYQVFVGCSGFITGVLLWLIEIFRKLPSISVKVGDKEYSIKKETKGEQIGR